MFDGFPKNLPRLARPFVDTKALKRIAVRFADLVPKVRPLWTAPDTDAVTDGFSVVANFGVNPGMIGMHLYIPSSAPSRGAPLIVVVHGCKQRAKEFATDSGWVAMARRVGAILVMPEQSESNNSGLCFNWFRPGDLKRDGGEMQSMRSMVAWAAAKYSINPSQTFIVGLSAGGAMTIAALASYPEVFAAGAVVAGLPAGGARGVPAAFTLMSGNTSGRTGSDWVEAARELGGLNGAAKIPRLSVWQGTADHTVNSQNAEAIVAQWVGVSSLPETPGADFSPAERVRRKVWERNGRPVMESWTITGFGHGYPTIGVAPVDPYVLPAPVDATTEIARFWGLLPPA